MFSSSSSHSASQPGFSWKNLHRESLLSKLLLSSPTNMFPSSSSSSLVHPNLVSPGRIYIGSAALLSLSQYTGSTSRMSSSHHLLRVLARDLLPFLIIFKLSFFFIFFFAFQNHMFDPVFSNSTIAWCPQKMKSSLFWAGLRNLGYCHYVWGAKIPIFIFLPHPILSRLTQPLLS